MYIYKRGVFLHLDRGKNPRYFFCMEKRAVENVLRICFLLFFVLILSAFFSLAFRPQKLISEEENRTLQTLPAFSFKSFLSSEYQDQLENAAADQLLFSKEIKYGVKQFYNALTSGFSALCAKNSASQTAALSESGEVAPTADISAAVSGDSSLEPAEEILPEKYDYVYTEVVAGKLYKLDESGYIIHKALPPEMYNFDLYDPDMLAAVKYPKYVFFIDTSLSTDFTEPGKFKPFDYIKTQIPADGYAELTFRNFEEYKQLFYQTDHHWNYKGSYKGYTLIMKMMEGEGVQLLEPVRTHTYNTVYNGSNARDNLLRVANELFTVYEFDLPPYKTFVDDVEAEYGYRSLYVSDEDFPHNTYSNHYGMYYGDDHAKVVYKFNQPEKESILILATSYSNAINELVASHYNETHILDFRYYKKTYGKPIDAQSYMEENHLSKLLLLGDISSLGYKRKN